MASDMRTEAALQAGLQHLLKGRTSFISAHRPSTLENADEIFYIDHGQIVEHGSYAQLLADPRILILDEATRNIDTRTD